MLESKVKVTPTKSNVKENVKEGAKAKSVPLIISAGEKINISSRGVSKVSEVDIAMQESNWQDHKLLVQGWPLSEVLAELNRFLSGLHSF